MKNFEIQTLHPLGFLIRWKKFFLVPMLCVGMQSSTLCVAFDGALKYWRLGCQIWARSAGGLHYNSVKRGYVDEPIHWRYSSARNYAGVEGLMEITMYQ